MSAVKTAVKEQRATQRYRAYVIGFVLSVITTLAAYLLVVNHVWPKEALIPVVLAIAVVQLVIQMFFFLHVGRSSHWRLLTLVFTVVIVLIVVVGSIWVMYNLNYNMMNMTPEQMNLYMSENEGI